MAEPKTKVTDASVEDFLASIEDQTRLEDSFEVLEIYERVTGLEPKMWGSSIVGFGMWHYKSKRSSAEGDWPLVAFSPRKQYMTLYIEPRDFPELLEKLGKHTTSVACLYIKKLADVDVTVLEKLIAASYKRDKLKYTG